MRIVPAVSAVMALGLSLGASTASAQTNTANITARAVVQAPINVTANQNLDFGNVFPGVNATIAATAAAAGSFSITGQASAPAKMTFTLPPTLASGVNTLTIGTWTGYWNTINSQVGGTAFIPSAAVTPGTFSATGNMFTFVGATVTPPSNQPAGTYTGSVTLTVTY